TAARSRPARPPAAIASPNTTSCCASKSSLAIEPSMAESSGGNRIHVDMEIQAQQTSLEEEPEADPEAEPQERGGWTVSLLCAGVAIIAVCLLLPLAEENHQLAWQREKLRVDLEQIKQQVAVNGEFLKKVADDPTLAERLAQRQMKFIREGTKVLELPGDGGKEEMSPFLLVSLPPPSPMPPYRPLGGALSFVVRNPRLRLYVTGIGLMMLACGLV